MIYAAIVAGGTGSRMGADIPKQFLEVGGKPIIVRTIESFLANSNIDRVYVGVHSDWTEKLGAMCRGLNMKRIGILPGGSDRNATVFKIVGEILREHEISESDILLTHDGVRPFVSQKIIDENISAMKNFGGVTTALPSTDTMLYSEDGGSITSVPERSKMFRAQTPQTFRLPELLAAYRSLDERQVSQLTDTASIFTSAGLQVGLVRGDENNIKITTPFDLKLAELIIQNM
jgi:2-C-methyl-D-erythritol 4-phosphate cytidylyltransferase